MENHPRYCAQAPVPDYYDAYLKNLPSVSIDLTKFCKLLLQIIDREQKLFEFDADKGFIGLTAEGNEAMRKSLNIEAPVWVLEVLGKKGLTPEAFYGKDRAVQTAIIEKLSAKKGAAMKGNAAAGGRRTVGVGGKQLIAIWRRFVARRKGRFGRFAARFSDMAGSFLRYLILYPHFEKLIVFLIR